MALLDGGLFLMQMALTIEIGTNTRSYMVLDLKIWKIQSCEYIQVPGGLDKWGLTVLIYISNQRKEFQDSQQ